MEPIIDYQRPYDPYGYELQVSAIAVADELAAAAELVMGKLTASLWPHTWLLVHTWPGRCAVLIARYSF